MRNCVLKVSMALILVMLTACGGTSPDAVTPSMSPFTGASLLNTHSFGTWDVALDPVTSSVDITSNRTSDFTANVTIFMQPPKSSTHLVGISINNAETDWVSGYVVLDVSFTHPFEGFDQFTGFDVRGLVIGDASQYSAVHPDTKYPIGGDLRLLNADGLTRWYNPSEFTSYDSILGFTKGSLGKNTVDFSSTVNAYKYYCDNLDPDIELADFFDEPSPNHRGYFSAGNTLTREYILQFPVPNYSFQYAVIASWEAPLESPPSVPTDFFVTANCPEAYLVSTADQSTLFWESPINSGGELILDVAVYDHQGIDKAFAVNGQVERIHLETHDGHLNNNFYTFHKDQLNSALLSNDTLKAMYRLTVPEEDIGNDGPAEFPVLVIVESSDPVNYDQGFPGVNIPDAPLAAFTWATVTIDEQIPENIPPEALAVSVTSTDIAPGESVEFDGSASNDPDGFITLYEWETTGDGLYDDATGPTPVIDFPDAGTFEVDLRVTDNDSATDTLTETITVNVTSAGEYIHVDDDNTSGPWDGTEANPFQYIQDGVDEAATYSVPVAILVHTGTYTEPTEMIEIDGLSDITITAEANAVVWPPATSGLGKHAIWVKNSSSNIVIEKLQIRPREWYEQVFKIDDSDTVTVQEITLNNPTEAVAYNRFLHSDSTDNLIVQDNDLDYFRSRFFDMRVIEVSGGDNITVTNNRCLNLDVTATSSSSAQTGYVQFWFVTGGEISKNMFGIHDRTVEVSSWGYLSGIRVNNSSNIDIRNNLIYDAQVTNDGTDFNSVSRMYGIAIEGSSSNCDVYNNTLDNLGSVSSYNGLGFTAGILNDAGMSHEFHSNIITNMIAPQFAECYSFYSVITNTLDYSCVYGVTGGVYYYYGGNGSAGTGSIIDDPVYVNPGIGNFNLDTGSPCIGTGKDGVDMGCYGGSDPLEY